MSSGLDGGVQGWCERLGAMDLDSAADELYGVAPSDFIATRQRLANEARDAGDKSLAAKVKALRKPTAPAWLVNQLVREHRSEIEPLLELGDEMRDVMADLEPDELRALTQQRYRLISALVQQTKKLGAARGARVADQTAQAVRETLEATLADPESAAAVSAGHLTEALRVTGFGFGAAPRRKQSNDQSAAGAGSDQANGTDNVVSDLDAKRQEKMRRKAAEAVETAEAAAQKADAELEQAVQQHQLVVERRVEAARVVDKLTAQLAAATAELDEIDGENHAAQADLADAKARRDDAREAIAEAREDLAEIDY